VAGQLRQLVAVVRLGQTRPPDAKERRLTHSAAAANTAPGVPSTGHLSSPSRPIQIVGVSWLSRLRRHRRRDPARRGGGPGSNDFLQPGGIANDGTYIYVAVSGSALLVADTFNNRIVKRLAE